ncbi:MAG: M50 family metallopeptidase [Clostridia bacterium]|nr:M50 family metallopeptidase [Clostridia bacterium]
MQLLSFSSIMSSILDKWTIVLAILFFGLIIITHELGHFCFAKLFKVKINEFAIGMGPKLFSKKKNNTTYSLRLLPIGGYVSMEGEDEDSEDENAFNKKSCWQRIVIVVAGALVNIILGLMLVGISQGISNSLSGSSYVNGFIIDDKKVTSYGGLQQNDKIIKIDGKRIYYYLDIYYLLGRNADGKADITIERNGEKIELTDAEIPTYSIVVFGTDRTAKTIIKDTFKESASTFRMIWLSVFDLITGKYSFKDVSGPVGVVDTVSKVAESSKTDKDYSGMISLMAMISINIGVFNLLPIPALDGGRLFFLLIELVRGKPVDPKREGLVHAIGLVILLLLMLAITFKDIWVLIVGG